nr:MAG TPA: hypothetical protein [Caudoviricetes sp.]
MTVTSDIHFASFLSVLYSNYSITPFLNQVKF